MNLERRCILFNWTIDQCRGTEGQPEAGAFVYLPQSFIGMVWQ
ncbi:MAG: hypothetical protein ACLPY2_01965 [Bryobacteraceae bacterium]|jgi:hypothetical protein